MSARHTVIDSPLGELTLVADGEALIGLYYPHHWYRPDPATFGPRADGTFDAAEQQLAEYFAGTRQTFDLPIRLHGDAFQRRVWSLIADIGYGRTSTYGELARQLGDPALARDVGAAVGRNPLCIIIPCHRVLGANGNLTGYAGGLPRKQHLLDLELHPALF
jgi:methylated-DNA-[protein]-cysteine S-methyltransferase